MGVYDRLAGLLRSGSDSDGESTADRERPPTLEDVADAPLDAPEQCPNCGEAFDAGDVVPPEHDGRVLLGEHQHVCHIGRRHDGPLAGWRVVHR
jgi:hypothetical protein